VEKQGDPLLSTRNKAQVPFPEGVYLVLHVEHGRFARGSVFFADKGYGRGPMK